MKNNMKCAKAEQLILLENSREISAPDAGELAAHIAECETCRDYRSNLEIIMDSARAALPAGTPSDKVMRRIMSKAREQHEGNVVYFNAPVRRLAAVAALVILAAGGWFLAGSNRSKAPLPGNDGTETTAAVSPSHIQTAHSLVEVVASSDISGPDSAGSTGEEQLKTLGRQLLRLEGFYIEEPDPENINGPAAPDARDLQSHSKFAFQVKTSV
jgi:anti-sigma factor RsiW